MEFLPPANAEELAIVATIPNWVGEQILSASQHVGEDRAPVWFSEN